MKEIEIIARLTKSKLELEEKVKSYEQALNYISASIYCMGGPLNDNVHRYNNKQLNIFSNIASEIKSVL